MTKSAGAYGVDLGQAIAIDDVPLSTAIAQVAARCEEALAGSRLRRYTHAPPSETVDDVYFNDIKGYLQDSTEVGWSQPIRLSAPLGWRCLPLVWPVSEACQSISVTLRGTVGHESMSFGLTIDSNTPPTSGLSTVSTSDTSVTLTAVTDSVGVHRLEVWFRGDIEETYTEILTDGVEGDVALWPVVEDSDSSLVVQSNISWDPSCSWWADHYTFPAYVIALTASAGSETPITAWRQVLMTFDTDPDLRFTPPFVSARYDGDYHTADTTELHYVSHKHGYMDVASIEVAEVGEARTTDAYDTGQQWSSSELWALIERLKSLDRTTRVYSLLPSLAEDPWGTPGVTYPLSERDGSQNNTLTWIPVDGEEAGADAYRLHMLVSDLRASSIGGDDAYYLTPTWHTFASGTWTADSALGEQYFYLAKATPETEQAQLLGRGPQGLGYPRPTVIEGRLLPGDGIDRASIVSFEIDAPTAYPAVLQVEVRGDRAGHVMYLHSIALEGAV